jgi:hypothetical protein
MTYRFTSVPVDLADQARSTFVSPQYHHPASRSIATGHGPCRVCLSTFETGRDERLLFTYNPFEEGVPAPGPVFVHADGCEPFVDTGVPPGLAEVPLLLEPLGADGLPVDRLRPAADEVDAAVRRALSDDAVTMIVVRHASAGCFIARVMRAET